MIARELTEFFASFSADGQPAVQRPGGQTFLSNVNACYARACWEEIRFREIAYSEDQAFGADLLEAGWIKVYQPSAAVLHAHDYGALEFMRRYFDEYRGLRESTGHVEAFGVLATARQVRAEVAGDRRWAAEQGLSGTEQASLTARSAVHHGGRRVFSALGSRADRLPAPVRGRLSLRGSRRSHGNRRRGRVRRRAGPLAGARTGRRAGCLPGPADHADRAQARSRRLPGRRPLLARGLRAAARSRARHGRARASAPGARDPLLPARQRRAQHAAADLLAPGAARASVQRLAVRLHRPTPRRMAGGDPRRHQGVLRADRGTRVQGLRGLAGRRRGDRHRLADRAPHADARPVPRAGLHRQRPRARVLRRLDRARNGRGHLPSRPALHRREPVAARPADRALRRQRRRLPARGRPLALPTAPGEPAARTP